MACSRVLQFLLTVVLGYGCAPQALPAAPRRAAQQSTAEQAPTAQPVSSELRALQAPHVDEPPPSAESSEASLCSLTGPGAPVPADPLKAFAAHLFIEEHQGGAVLRLDSPPAQHVAARAKFDELGLRKFAFYPCATHLVLWIPGYAMCRDYEENAAGLAPYLPDFRLVTCFTYDHSQRLDDCRTGRLPRDRCRQWLTAAFSQHPCQRLDRTRRAALLGTATALDLLAEFTAACGAEGSADAP